MPMPFQIPEESPGVLLAVEGPWATEFQIGRHRVGEGYPVLVIAEAGVAHFGDVGKAFALVDLASEAGADIFKIQVFETDRLVAPSCPEWRDRLKSRELGKSDIARVKEKCDARGITFMATAHEPTLLDFLDHELHVPAFKVGSGEVENWRYMRRLAKRGKPIILSTGMYQMPQIKKAIGTVAEGDCRELAVLHCVTLYPTPPELVNLGVMETVRSFFPGPVGYSDHTKGTAVALAAVALGARIIEKHIALETDVPNAQDWKVSCTPEDFPKFVADLRTVERAVGTGLKQVTAAERENLAWARKSLFASCDIPKGTTVLASMLVEMRPGTGLPPSRLDGLVGTVARRDIPSGRMISEEDFFRS